MSRITTDQLAELHAQDKAGTVTRELLQAFLRNPGSALQRTDAPVAAPPPEITPTVGPSFKFKVNYKLTLAAMIALGKYDWKNDDITAKNFPHDNTLGEVEIEAECVHYGRNMSYDAVIADLDARGMRPATMVELLAFGAANPEEQRKFPIIALGSVYTDRYGRRCVGYLGRDGSERVLDLNVVGGDWYDVCRFLAVRK